MASPKSGDDPANGAPPKRIAPDSTERPGVYVQVAGTPRKKKSSSSYKALESGNHAVEETRPAHANQASPRRSPGPLGMRGEAEVRSEPAPASQAAPRSQPAPRSQSEVRERQPVRSDPPAQTRARAPRIVEINESMYESRAESENTNYRADMVRASAAPNSLSARPERLSGPAALDAPERLRSDASPARMPWGVIALVSVMSAIITAAGVVALQEWLHSDVPAAEVASPATAPTAAPVAATAPAPVPVVPAPAPPVPEEAAAPAPAAAAPAVPDGTAEPTALPTVVVAEVPAEPAPAAVAAPAPAAEEAAPAAPAPAARTRASRRSHTTAPAAKPDPETAGPAGTPALPVAIPDNPYASDVAAP